jgi:hypothetical protein
MMPHAQTGGQELARFLVCYNSPDADRTQETRMDLPVKFPSNSEVILEEVARFRALAPEDQFQSLRSLLKAGDPIIKNSPNAEWARQYALEQEILAQQNIRDFISRHGY